MKLAVLQREMDERNQGICEHTISDAESLLTNEDRLNSLCLSVSLRKYLRKKLRRAIVQVRSILQEAVAYYSFQFLKLSEQCK
jgi:hypothetical protein